MADTKIRQRIEACQLGLSQLETLRAKHRLLMEQLRTEYPELSNAKRPRLEDPEKEVQCQPSVAEEEKQPVQAEVSPTVREVYRMESPASLCISHRSSVSGDSGCLSLSSDQVPQSNVAAPMPYSAFRKISIEDRLKSVNSDLPAQSDEEHIVASTIECTTALKPVTLPKPRPHSMYSSTTSEVNDLDPVPPFSNTSGVHTAASKSLESKFLDSLSFSQLTPPPVQRKFATVQPPSPIRHTSEARLVLNNGAHARAASSTAPESRAGLNVSSHHRSTSTQSAFTKPVKPPSPPVAPVAPRQASGRLCSPVYSKPQRSPQAVFRAAPVFIARSGQNSSSSSKESSPETLRPTRPRMHQSVVGSVTSVGQRSPIATHHAQPVMVSSPYSSYRQPSMASIVGRQRREKGWFESEGL